MIVIINGIIVDFNYNFIGVMIESTPVPILEIVEGYLNKRICLETVNGKSISLKIQDSGVSLYTKDNSIKCIPLVSLSYIDDIYRNSLIVEYFKFYSKYIDKG